MPISDAAAFAQWVRPQWPAMHRLARRMAGPQRGDDVVQEALAAAWRKRSQFDPGRGSARSWLLAIVADQAGKTRRRVTPSAELRDNDNAVEGTGFGSQRVDSQVSSRVDLDRLRPRLTDRQRLAVDLYYYLNLPLAEVAGIMRCSVGTVKSTLADARARLRTLLGEDYR